MIFLIENFMYKVSNTFLFPVLLLIVGLFFYSLFEIGVFFMQAIKRKISGYPIINYEIKRGFYGIEDLEAFAFKKLQVSSLVTKISPMLGLVATMILKALSNRNIQRISENLIIAFAAVIFALIYWITIIRKGWYAKEIKDLLLLRGAKDETSK
ncbi:biopolymer transporter ExbD [Malaciobacter mytili]|uniref:MotA/TolQ/ExbB proton channel family protein n=1 Tax=Malaciobacter mytili TaxID=603050 RepID=UPI00100BBEF8|nr:MotA/TolQ/ExbB proton channel family protein [Malaciobacter mytili]RXI36593.1 biopolymer transporter ExbD [Malaciobacter mytili]